MSVFRPGTSRDPGLVPLNRDAVAVLEAEKGKHASHCFTYRGAPIRWGRLQHRVALGGWKSRVMVDRYAKLGAEHLSAAAARIENVNESDDVANVLRFRCVGKTRRREFRAKALK